MHFRLCFTLSRRIGQAIGSSFGFSAGGHLALWAGVQAKNRPNGMILSYPAVSAPNIPGADFMLKLLMGREHVTDEDAKQFDLLRFVDKSAPPVFLVATAEDMLTNYGALQVANHYARLGLGYELHIFQHGPHGYSLANATSANGNGKLPVWAPSSEGQQLVMRLGNTRPHMGKPSMAKMTYTMFTNKAVGE